MKKFTSLLLSLIIVVAVAANTVAAANLDTTAGYLMDLSPSPTVSSVGGEWTVIGLARSEADVPQDYYDSYYRNVVDYVKAKDGVLHSRKYTEYSRVILALTAIGKNPQNVGGYNIVTPLADYDKTVQQGINGAIWAVIALNSGRYGTEAVIDKYIDCILAEEKKDGGWSFSPDAEAPEADITAMALIALSGFSQRENVKEAIDRGIAVLSKIQNEDGGYTAYGIETAESTAQVLTAVSTLGISPSDERFVKNGNSLLDNLLSFKNADGSFSHTDKSNVMATEQCYYALTAVKRAEEKKTPLFDMSDVKNKADIRVPSITNAGKSFADIKGHKNQYAIEKLTERGIINGIDENSFAPERTMTRAEFAVITVKALGLSPEETAVFEDVEEGSWYAGYVDTAYEYGIVSGMSDSEFNPMGTITTEQAFVMITGAASLCGLENALDETAAKGILSEFSDGGSVSEWAVESVAFCFESGIADNDTDKITPTEPIKRCEIAYMLFNLLKGAELV